MWEQADRVIRAIPLRSQRVAMMQQLGKRLRLARQWERAVAMWADAQVASEEAGTEVADAYWYRQSDAFRALYAEQIAEKNRWWEKLLHELAADARLSGAHEDLLSLVQHMWLHADTRAYAISLLA
ncbi:MAG TPA: hypothetical protein VGF67_25570 [Ktedonobacteraceae bacterium]|jgi:hypothetical protein